jgi:uncharacterized membrane protein YccC
MILGLNTSIAGMLAGFTLVGIGLWVPAPAEFHALCMVLGAGLIGVCILHWIAHVLDRLIKRLIAGRPR